jgi:two-component system sensor histidine kinase QseC
LSIRRYLTLVLLSVITLFTFAAAIQGYRCSMAKATSVFDNELRSLTHVLVNITDLSTQSLVPQPAAAFVYQIWQDNRLIVSSHPQLKTAISDFKSEFSEHNFWLKVGVPMEIFSNQVINGS